MILIRVTAKRNVVHRHEPPVTSTPVKVLSHDIEREFIVVDKPGSIVRSSWHSLLWPQPWYSPFDSRSTHLDGTTAIHSSRSLLTILDTPNVTVSEDDLDPPSTCINRLAAANRLDRLTSGLMIIPLSADCARQLTLEFTAGTVRKEYIARVKGRFPS